MRCVTAIADVNDARRFRDMLSLTKVSTVRTLSTIYDITITASLRDDMNHGHHVSEACHIILKIVQARRHASQK